MASTRPSREQLLLLFLKLTRLNRDEINNLMERFECLCYKEDGKLHRDEFRDELNRSFGISDDMVMDRVFKAFDSKSCGALRREDYIQGVDKFLNGTLEDHVNLCFAVYDVNNDGYISREDMFQLLKNCLVKAPTEEDPDEMVKELIETVLKKLDTDHDGRVSRADFTTAIADDKLMLESLGKCLPDRSCTMAFQEIIRTSGSGHAYSSVNISQQKRNQRKGDQKKI